PDGARPPRECSDSLEDHAALRALARGHEEDAGALGRHDVEDPFEQAATEIRRISDGGEIAADLHEHLEAASHPFLGALRSESGPRTSTNRAGMIPPSLVAETRLMSAEARRSRLPRARAACPRRASKRRTPASADGGWHLPPQRLPRHRWRPACPRHPNGTCV